MRQMPPNQEPGGAKSPVLEAIERIYQTASEPTRCHTEQEMTQHGIRLAKQPSASGYYTRFYHVSVSSASAPVPIGSHLAKEIDLPKLRPMALATMLDYGVKIMDYISRRQIVPHVARVYHMFLVDNRLLYIVMQHYPHHSVHWWMARVMPISTELVKNWSLQLASVCCYMMENGIAHRSIRVEHLLLDKDDNLHLTGWSRAVFVAHPVTCQPELCGREPRDHKRNHLPPECFLLPHYSPFGVDHWSFATMVVAFFTSRHCFRPREISRCNYNRQWIEFVRRHGSRIDSSVLPVLNRAFHLAAEKRANVTEIIQASFFKSKTKKTNSSDPVTGDLLQTKNEVTPNLTNIEKSVLTYSSVKSSPSDKKHLEGNVVRLEGKVTTATTMTNKSVIVSVSSTPSDATHTKGLPPRCISPISVMKLTGTPQKDLPINIPRDTVKVDAIAVTTPSSKDTLRSSTSKAEASITKPIPAAPHVSVEKNSKAESQVQSFGKPEIPITNKNQISHLDAPILSKKTNIEATEQKSAVSSRGLAGSDPLKDKTFKKQVPVDSSSNSSAGFELVEFNVSLKPPIIPATKEIENEMSGLSLSLASQSETKEDNANNLVKVPRLVGVATPRINKDLGQVNLEPKGKDSKSWSSDYLTAPIIVSTHDSSHPNSTSVPDLKTYPQAVQVLLGSKSTTDGMVCVRIKASPKANGIQPNVVNSPNAFGLQDSSPSSVSLGDNISSILSSKKTTNQNNQ